MIEVSASRYRVRLAGSERDVAAVQRLRYRVFRGQGEGSDADLFDGLCAHVMVEETGSARLAACCRLMALGPGGAIGASYSARFYDLAPLCGYAAPIVEVGRFCIDPGVRDPDVLRLAWAAVTRFVDTAGAGMLCGCTSFAGVDPEPFRAAFAHLAAHHLAQARWRPGPKAPETVPLASAGASPDRGAMPPLLRSYLAMGAWVSDHAVIDRELGTIHVFTGLEVAAIPPARRASLRALAGDIDGGKGPG